MFAKIHSEYATVFITHILLMVPNALIPLVILGRLGTAVFGKYAFLFAVAGIMSMVMDFGRKTKIERLRANSFRSQFIRANFWTLIAFVSVFALTFFIEVRLSNYLPLMSVIVLFDSLFELKLSRLKSAGFFRLETRARLLKRCLAMAFICLVCVRDDAELIELIYAHLFVSFASYLALTKFKPGLANSIKRLNWQNIWSPYQKNEQLFSSMTLFMSGGLVSIYQKIPYFYFEHQSVNFHEIGLIAIIIKGFELAIFVLIPIGNFIVFRLKSLKGYEQRVAKRKYITGQISLFSSVIVIISIGMIFTFYDFLMQLTNDLFVTTSLIVLICLPFAAANLVFTKFLTVELKDQTIFAVISYSFVCAALFTFASISLVGDHLVTVMYPAFEITLTLFCLISLRRIDVATLDKSQKA